MKVQQLIEEYEKLEGVWNAEGAELARQIFLEDLKQLDEPQPVKVPQFVADWYEENKDVFEANLYQCAYNIPSSFDSAKLNEFERWFLTAGTKPFQTLVNMHQFGYKVEEEKRYLVKMKGIDTNFNFLNRHRNENYWIFSSKDKNTLYQTHHTRKELEEADFGWVFDCPGIEIEEVKE